MRATSPLRLSASARAQYLKLADRQDVPELDTEQPVPALRRPAEKPKRWEALRRSILSILVLAVIWGGLTGWRADALVFGVPALLLGAALPLLLSHSAPWRLSLRGAIVFALWFAVQSVRGAVDVALRAFAPHMPLRPGFRSHVLALPHGAPRIMFINTITLLPGTLSAECVEDTLIVHMLDTRTELKPPLCDLETRIRALFALPQDSELSE